MTVGSQMPELERGGFFAPPYKIVSQNTPYKVGVKEKHNKITGEHHFKIY